MSDIIFTANQNFHNTCPIGKPYKHKVHYSLAKLNRAKPCVSVVDTFAVTTIHLVGRNVNSVEKKSTLNTYLLNQAIKYLRIDRSTKTPNTKLRLKGK